MLQWVRADSSICELGVGVKVSEFGIYSLSTNQHLKLQGLLRTVQEEYGRQIMKDTFIF